MHKFFPEWYRIADPEPSQEILKNRWDAIDKIINDFELEEFYSIVRLFLGMQIKEVDFIDKFRSFFQDADATFQMRNNDLELRVLAGSAILAHIEAYPDNSINIALATICADLQGKAPSIPVPEIVNLVEAYLIDKSYQIRHRRNPIVFDSLSNEFNTLSEAYGQNSFQLGGPPIETILKSYQSSISLLEKLNEETNILWWLFSAYSNDLGTKMVDIALPASCLVAGKELADLIKILPGPLSALAFLDKMISQNRRKVPEQISIKEAINKADYEWKKQCLKGKSSNDFIDFCPLHFGLDKSVELKGKDTWISSFEEVLRIKVSESLPPAKLALSLYRERLLLNSIK